MRRSKLPTWAARLARVCTLGRGCGVSFFGLFGYYLVHIPPTRNHMLAMGQ